jgi:hypothetical protein
MSEKVKPHPITLELLGQESLGRVSCAMQELGVDEDTADCKAATVVLAAVAGAPLLTAPSEPCERCGGNGLLDAGKYTAIDCPDCKGTGIGGAA